MFNKIGILGAMDDEVAQLFEIMENKSQTKHGGIIFFEGTLSGKQAVLCCAGMGKSNAAAATQILASIFKVDAIVFCGIAGNMTNKISVGDAAISDTVVYHDAENRMIAEVYPNMQVFTANDALIKAASEVCQACGIKHIVGRVATGDKFIGEKAVKEQITAAFAPVCVEMEGAAVAHIAAKNDIPFVIVRIMSDDADEEGAEKLVDKPFDISAFIADATKICKGICERI